MMSKKLLASLALASMCLGCSQPGSSQLNTPDSVSDIVQVMRDTVSYSYVAYENPEEMLKAVDLAAVGTISSIEPAMVADELDGQGAVIVGIRVEEFWKDDPDRVGDTVYFWFLRPKEADIDEYRKSLPVGTELTMFGFDTAGRVKFSSGAPEATVYEPAPQGLWLPGKGTTLVNVWGSETRGPGWRGVDSLRNLRGALPES